MKIKLSNLIILILLILILFFIIKRSTNIGDYIIICKSNNNITDIYKLKNSKFIFFENKNIIKFNRNGDDIILDNLELKIIKINNNKNNENPSWYKYQEYHSEFESRTYNELYNLKKSLIFRDNDDKFIRRYTP